MLSRHAERVYWLARYVERVEDTARIINAYSLTALDTPVGTEMGWEMLLKIMGAEHTFYKRYKVASENNIVKFLISDSDNPSSIRMVTRAARENVRSARDIIPYEGWELWNELHLYVTEFAEASIGRRKRYEFLSSVIDRCRAFNGLLDDTLNRDQAHVFHTIGKFLERADMASRVVDVGAGYAMHREEVVTRFDSLLWTDILKANSALLMYRRVNGPRVSSRRVIRFLCLHAQFPRSLLFCINEVEAAAKVLPHPEAVLSLCESHQNTLMNVPAGDDLTPENLHEFLDDVQSQLITIGNEISHSWFITNSH